MVRNDPKFRQGCWRLSVSKARTAIKHGVQTSTNKTIMAVTQVAALERGQETWDFISRDLAPSAAGCPSKKNGPARCPERARPRALRCGRIKTPSQDRQPFAVWTLLRPGRTHSARLQQIEFFDADLHFADDGPQCAFGHVAGMAGNGNGQVFRREIINRVPTRADLHEARAPELAGQFTVRNGNQFSPDIS